MVSVGVTTRSTCSNARSSVAGQARWTDRALRSGRSCTLDPTSQARQHLGADPVGVLRHQPGVGVPGLGHQAAGRPARVASSHPASGSARLSHPTSCTARSRAATKPGVRLDGHPAHRRSPVGDSGHAEPRLEQLHPAVTSPATSRAMGPTVSRLGARGRMPSRGTRPHVVFSPAVPQQAAGIRIDHPCRCRRPRPPRPSATATADPLDDPPGTRSASSGFTGVPYHGLIPVTPKASSLQVRASHDARPCAPGPGQAGRIRGRPGWHGPPRLDTLRWSARRPCR